MQSKRRQQLEQELAEIETQVGETLFAQNNEGLASIDQDVPLWSVTPWWVSVLTNTKLCYVILLLILLFGAWGIVDQLPVSLEKPPATELKQKTPNDRIAELEREFTKLRGDFESLDDYPGLLPEIREKAPVLAKQLLNVSDENMAIGHKILKYSCATATLAIAASVEKGTNEIKEFTDLGITSGGKTINLINEAIENSSNGSVYENNVEKWIRSEHLNEHTKYRLAILYAIKAHKLSDADAIPEIEKFISELPGSYKEKYPLEKEENLNWYLKQRRESNESKQAIDRN